MAWTIELSGAAEKALKKPDRQTAQRITGFLRERVAEGEGPRSIGQAIDGPLAGMWRYRVGDFRIICEIEDDKLIVLVLNIRHRGDIYRR